MLTSKYTKIRNHGNWASWAENPNQPPYKHVLAPTRSNPIISHPFRFHMKEKEENKIMYMRGRTYVMHVQFWFLFYVLTEGCLIGNQEEIHEIMPAISTKVEYASFVDAG